MLLVAAALSTFVAWPLVEYDRDVGLVLGAFGAYYDHGSDTEPYRYAVQGQVALSTRGAQDHDLGVDLPDLGGFRLTLDAHFVTDHHAHYFGLGNATSATGPPELYAAILSQLPGVRLLVRHRVAGPLFAVAGGRAIFESVGATAGSLLAATRPLGVDGGRAIEATAGFLLDRRDREIESTRGWALEATARVARHALGSEFTYSGFNVTGSGFLPLGDRVVVAARGIADALFGDPPFFMLPELGGLAWLVGPGGGTTLRGYPRGRLLGSAKVLATVEVRARVASFAVLGHGVDVGAVGFSDAARVFSHAAPDGPLLSGKASAGVGARLVVDRDLVVRFDWAHALGGDPDSGFYALLGETF